SILPEYTSDCNSRSGIAANSMCKKYLRDVVHLQIQEWTTRLESKHSGNFDVVRYACHADYDDSSTFLNNYRSGYSQNTARYT
ncbi:oligopeptide ABC transporter substrate-binding protein OppA, partial [Cronobacter sakazakii]